MTTQGSRDIGFDDAYYGENGTDDGCEERILAWLAPLIRQRATVRFVYGDGETPDVATLLGVDRSPTGEVIIEAQQGTNRQGHIYVYLSDLQDITAVIHRINPRGDIRPNWIRPESYDHNLWLEDIDEQEQLTGWPD